ncbi:MAG TPA: 50S ribosomal protein L17 [Candidatus Moranbacteria bacterium]|nr:MAG: 50S ribosomal protein L17 [Candidatus Moranbacteria bacterium GW2011_GWC2_45_10]KKT95533.1 MAG: 50S ribosomal protein L17, large subunit ribosomal protein L17 [Parcubacteria group bacterium GW2011_GWC1_45_14]HAV11059.1 50S ribosomal protein L17 [Candidatus Moranbacteria bacterium]
MKHRVKGRKFSRLKGQRTAFLKTLVGSLIVKEKITTTEARAKEIKGIVDRMVGKALKIKKDESKKVSVIRDLRKHMPLVAVKKLSSDFTGKFEGRASGFVRVIKLERRKGDSAKMAVIEFV